MYEYKVITIGDPRQRQGRRGDSLHDLESRDRHRPDSEPNLEEQLNELAAAGYRLHTQLSMDRRGPVLLIMERLVATEALRKENEYKQQLSQVAIGGSHSGRVGNTTKEGQK